MARQQHDPVSLREHLEALRVADHRFQEERDRRYAEVNIEREKALKIKETADLAALQLAREIQTYKDEKANELRSQIERERGSYVTQPELRSLEDKILALLSPIQDSISKGQGKSGGFNQSWLILMTLIPIAIALFALMK